VKKKQDEKAKEDAETFLGRVKGGETMAGAGKAYKADPAVTGWFKRNEPIPGIGYEPAISQAVFKLSSSMPLIEEVMERLRAAGLGHVPVVVGGIIPEEDAARLRAMGVARVYTPKDFELNRIMFDIVALADPREVAAE